MTDWWAELGPRGARFGAPRRWPESIRLVNLRSLSDTGDLPLPSLVILVGANGSGKSTFARFFPLLKQSVETPTRGPLLWYQQDLVDFGNFESAVRRDQLGGRCDHLAFHFRLAPFDIKLRVEGEARETRLSQVQVTGFHGDTVELKFDPDGRVTVFRAGDDVDVLALEPEARWIASLSGVIPELWDDHGYGRTALTAAVVDHINWVFHQNTARARREEFARRLTYAEDLRPQFQAAGFGKKWGTATKNFLAAPPQVARLRRLLLARLAPSLLNAASAWLDLFARGVAYIGPFRATPQRYYRQQELAVDVIDPKGGNLAMFLRSLTSIELEQFNLWVWELFGFRVRVGADGSQDTINLDFGEARSYNLVDTGFGYSQILPVLVQLWAMAFRDDALARFPLSVVVIEQPELHLHPHQQALFARALASAAGAGRARLVVETHSEAIVSELGAAVEAGKLTPDRLSVLCFEPDRETAETRVRVARYTADGGLENWPVGFFTP